MSTLRTIRVTVCVRSVGGTTFFQNSPMFFDQKTNIKATASHSGLEHTYIWTLNIVLNIWSLLFRVQTASPPPVIHPPHRPCAWACFSHLFNLDWCMFKARLFICITFWTALSWHKEHRLYTPYSTHEQAVHVHSLYTCTDCASTPLYSCTGFTCTPLANLIK